MRTPHRVVFPRLELIANDRHFTVQILPGNEGVHHSVGFQIQRPIEIRFIGLKRLEVIGSIEPGRSVRTGTMLRQFLRNIGMLRSSFEEKVLQKVGHPRFAIVLVKGTNQISDVNCDGLFGKIRKKQHPQSVGQAILRNTFDRSDTLDPLGQ